jgi:adenylate kinase
MTMQLIFLGLETVSVNTQAAILAKQLGVPHISMLQLFSHFMRDRCESDLQAILPSDMRSPDIEKLAMLEVRLRQSDTRQGWILTDFPKCLAQAQPLHLLLEYMGYSQPQALYLSVAKHILLERLSADQLAWNQRLLSPVIEYYQELECLMMIDGNTTPSIINERILDKLQITMLA